MFKIDTDKYDYWQDTGKQQTALSRRQKNSSRSVSTPVTPSQSAAFFENAGDTWTAIGKVSPSKKLLLPSKNTSHIGALEQLRRSGRLSLASLDDFKPFTHINPMQFRTQGFFFVFVSIPPAKNFEF